MGRLTRSFAISGAFVVATLIYSPQNESAPKSTNRDQICSPEQIEELKRQYEAEKPKAPSSNESCNPLASFPLFALFRGGCRVVFETPQMVCSGVADLLDDDRTETTKVKLCSYPLCYYPNARIPFSPGDHVFPRIDYPGCETGDLQWGSRDGSLCGPGQLDNDPIQSYPELICRNVTKHRWPGLPAGARDPDECDRAQMLACFQDKMKNFELDYCLFGTNCGDISNFLLHCAGLSARVQPNLNLLGNEGQKKPKVKPEGMKRCCGGDLPPGRELDLKELCEVLRQECFPCPVGTCYSNGSCQRPERPLGGTADCSLCTKNRYKDNRGRCVCPEGSEPKYEGSLNGTCFCSDPRRSIDQTSRSCVCSGSQIEVTTLSPQGSVTKKECRCPLEGTLENPGRQKFEGGTCVCRGGGLPSADTCQCHEEGTRSTFENGQCVCKDGFQTFKWADRIYCCSSEEKFNEVSLKCESIDGKAIDDIMDLIDPSTPTHTIDDQR